MVVRQPAQQGHVLRPGVGVGGVAGGGQRLRGADHERAHGGVVVHRGAGVGEGGGDPGQHRRAPVGPHVGKHDHDDGLDDRLAALRHAAPLRVAAERDDGVGQGAHLQPGLGQLPHQAVDQERPVGLHHAQHLDPVRPGSEVDLGLPKLAGGGEGPGGGQRLRQDRAARGRVVAHVLHRLAHEAAGGGVGGLGAHRLQHLGLQAGGLEVGRRVVHGGTGGKRLIEAGVRGDVDPSPSRFQQGRQNERRRRAGRARRRGFRPRGRRNALSGPPPEGT